MDARLIKAMVIGDGCLDIHKRYRNARFTCTHSIKQKEYALWKRGLLSDSGLRVRYDEFWNTTNPHTGKRGLMCRLESCVDPFLTNLRPLMYPKLDGFKPGVLDDLEAIHLAIIFMDDGTKCVNKHCRTTVNWVPTKVECTPYLSAFRFCLQSHGVEGANQFIGWLDSKFGIHARIAMIKGSPVVEIGRRVDKEKFVETVRPFMHETIMYKLEGSFSTTIVRRDRLSEKAPVQPG